MGTSPYGCCPGCVIASDEFNRADLGCLWEVPVGDWDIYSNTLREKGTAGAVAVHDHPAPGNSPFRAVVSAKLPSLVEGGRYRVIVNYADPDNYFFAEYHHSASGSSLSLYRRAGGSNTLLLKKDDYPGGEYLEVCFTPESFAAHMPIFIDEWVWVCDPVAHATGHYAGVGNGGTTAITFDDFAITQHYPPATCPQCQCLCDASCIPSTLTLTMTVVGPNCQTIHGATATLKYNFDNKRWEGTTTVCGVAFEITYWCDGNPTHPDDHVLTIADNLCVFNFLDQIADYDASTCDPLSLVFGPTGIAYVEEVGQLCPCCDPNTSDNLLFTITE